MIKIAVDAMGGDYAPREIVQGVNLAIKEHKDLYINLYGKKEEKHEIKDESNHFFFHHHTGSDRDVCLDVLLFCRV